MQLHVFKNLDGDIFFAITIIKFKAVIKQKIHVFPGCVPHLLFYLGSILCAFTQSHTVSKQKFSGLH